MGDCKAFCFACHLYVPVSEDMCPDCGEETVLIEKGEQI